jgi:hypothetical protein
MGNRRIDYCNKFIGFHICSQQTWNLLSVKFPMPVLAYFGSLSLVSLDPPTPSEIV